MSRMYTYKWRCTEGRREKGESVPTVAYGGLVHVERVSRTLRGGRAGRRRRRRRRRRRGDASCIQFIIARAHPLYAPATRLSHRIARTGESKFVTVYDLRSPRAREKRSGETLKEISFDRHSIRIRIVGIATTTRLFRERSSSRGSIYV